MPSSVNGIGTMYYGKKNLETRSGVCEFCHRETLLDSYETRLWGIFLFIPVIPLGRKKIFDDCRVCRRHRVISLGKWQEIERDTTSQAIQQADANPDDPQAAMQLHATLVGFRRFEEARQLADIMADKFPENVDVLIHLGGWYVNTGQDSRGDALFARALALAPDNLDARRAVGIAHLEQGQLDKAWELLSFMEQPGPKQDPRVLVMVADHFQEAGRHETALRLYETAGRAHSGVFRDKAISKRIRQSEAAMGRTRSLAPKSKRPLVVGALVVAALVAAVAALFIANSYLTSHQTLHAVNGLDAPVQVTIDGEDHGSLVPGQRGEIPITEGKHQAVIRQGGQVIDTIDFSIDNSFTQRMGQSSVFVLNPRGAADLLWQSTVYRVVPREDDGRRRLHFGEKFFVFREIDYPFKEFPLRVDLDNKNSSATKTNVDVVPEHPVIVVNGLGDEMQPDELLRYAEHHLTIHPNDADLLKRYFELVMSDANGLNRVKEFLEKGLERRPVAIDWHRAYQGLVQASGDVTPLIARYDQALKKDPKNSALLYLRGRIDPEPVEADRYFRQAITADPTNPYPLFAKSYVLSNRGQYADARPLAAKACELAPDNVDMLDRYNEIRFALREYATLREELRDRLANAPFDLAGQVWMLRVLVASGQNHAARTSLENFANQLQIEAPAGAPLATACLRAFLHYLLEEREDCLAVAAQLPPGPTADHIAFWGLLELGRIEEAEMRVTRPGQTPTTDQALVLSMAFHDRGNAAKAKTWWDSAIGQFKNGSTDDRAVAVLLTSEQAPSLEEFDKVTIVPKDASLLLVALAQRHPDQRAAYLERAAKLNMLNGFPYHFLRKRIESLSK
ncbi:MAG: hypothetical protein JW818_01840 [Pirellulales bacterium]|nr:hypothetical protein [Pirellulales bacterium]